MPFARHPAPSWESTAVALPNLQGNLLFVRLRCDLGQNLVIARADRLDYSSGQTGDSLDAVRFALALLAAGLSLVTRSRAFALLSLIVFTGLVRSVMNNHFPHWFPNAVPPPHIFTLMLLSALFVFTQWLFYDQFFQARKRHKRLSAFFLASLIGVVVMPFSYVQSSITQNTIALELLFTPPLLFYATATAIAVASGRTGNRSAWFVAAGTFFFTLNASEALVSGLPGVTVSPILEASSPFVQTFDIMLFMLAVGDESRETSLAYAQALRNNDVAQAAHIRQQQQHIAEIERRNSAFARFVPREFLQQLEKTDVVDVRLGDHVERDMAVLFTDIRGFTSLAESQAPSETFAFINAYLARAGPVIRTHGGFIDKCVGDAIVALFPNQPSDALDAAIALQSEVRRFTKRDPV